MMQAGVDKELLLSDKIISDSNNIIKHTQNFSSNQLLLIELRGGLVDAQAEEGGEGDDVRYNLGL